MSNTEQKVFLNRFAVKQLTPKDKTVFSYSYKFNNPPEPGKEYSAVNRITWDIRTPGVKFGSRIITKNAITEQYLTNKDWQLTFQGHQELNPNKANEKLALEKLERRWLGMKLRTSSEKYRVENYAEGGYIWWNLEEFVKQGDGWEVHAGRIIDLEIDSYKSGYLFVETDIHHRFYSPWTLEKWKQKYPKSSIKWVRNTYDSQKWHLKRITNENPNQVMIEGLGISLAQYHLQKGATETEIRNAKTVYVTRSRGRSQSEIAHLSTRLEPLITMETLGYLSEQGSQEATNVFTTIRQSPRVRFDKAQETAQWLIKTIYQKQITTKPKFAKGNGILLRNKEKPLLAKWNREIARPVDVFKHGCLRSGETQFGCLDLVGNGEWPKGIESILKDVANKSGADITLESAKKKNDLSESSFSRQEFWQNWFEQGTQTVLVVSHWLESSEKTRLRLEALQAKICLQFMQPMPILDKYRAYNIILGLLLKAKWQPVGLKPLDDPKAAEIVIGFDAGKNSSLYYGTSAFAVLGDGQSLGWELPEAQPGETLNKQVVLRTVFNIVSRFKKIKNRLPKRILLLRDGLIQLDEFKLTINELEKEKIAVDLLSVRKSRTGRMVILPYQSENFEDAQPGTAILSKDNCTFKIVTSKAIAGGSARPLKVVRDYGDAPLEILARQVDRLAMLNPASAYTSSRLPYVIHFADRMAKEVQRLGNISCLHKLDREKIFFA